MEQSLQKSHEQFVRELISVPQNAGSSLCGYQHLKKQHHLPLLVKFSQLCRTPSGTPRPHSEG